MRTEGPRRRAGRWVRVAGVLAATLVGLIAQAAPASAHSTLISSSPATDAVLPTPPTSVELVFNEQIRDFQPKLAITVGDHDPVEITPTVDGPTVTADLTGVDLPTAAGPGRVAWKIGYRVVSADGHPVSGLVPFSVGDGPAPYPSTTSSTTSATAPATAAPGAATGAATASDGSGWRPGWWALGVAALAVLAVLLVRRGRPGDPSGGR